MLLQDFSGGLNTRVAPSLLQANEAQVYTNIDNAKGSITPVLGNTSVTTGIDKYFTWYYSGEEFISSATESSFVEYRNNQVVRHEKVAEVWQHWSDRGKIRQLVNETIDEWLEEIEGQ